MRLLSRSRLGTWLLAGAVWCAACAAFWCALPVVPRAVMRLPEGSRLLGFGPDGESLVVLREENAEINSLDLLAISDGQCISTLVESAELEQVRHFSTDCRWLILGHHTALRTKVDLLNRTVATLEAHWDVETSSDKSYFIGKLNAADGWHSMQAFDCVGSIVRAIMPGSGCDSVAEDGKSFVVSLLGSPPNRFKVISVPLLSERGLFAGPPSDSALPAAVRLSEAGDYLAIEFQSPGSTVFCWQVNQGRLCINLPLQNPQFIKDGALIAARYSGNDLNLDCFELPSGSVRYSIPVTNRHWQLSTDRNTILVFDPQWTSQTIADKVMYSIGLQRLINRSDQTVRLYDAHSGEPCGQFPSNYCRWFPRPNWDDSPCFWSADNRKLATFDPDSPFIWHIWDIPPRKSLTWFAAGAALLALPIAFLAWRRTRKLRAA